MPKPKFEVTELHLRIIEDMAGRGAVLDDIAYVIGCAPATLDRLKSRDERIEIAYRRGKAIAIDKVATRLFDLAQEGDITAIIFYLKSQAKWNDRPIEQTPTSTGGDVQIYLPKQQAHDQTTTGAARRGAGING